MDRKFFHPPFAESVPESRMADYTRQTSLEDARHSVEKEFPELKIESFKPFGEGMGNDIFIVNGKDLFRFSKKEEGSESMAQEATLLPELESSLSVPIPHFNWVKRLENGNVKFVGYAMLSGTHPKEKDAYSPAGIPDAKLASQFGQFFTELHSFDAEKARSLGVTERDYRDFYTRQLNDCRNILFPILRKKSPEDAETMIDKIEKAYVSYLEDPTNFTFERKLLHGDLENENMLIDPERKVVTGVIDWGGAHLGDPDFDLLRPYVNLKKGFMDEILKTYQHPDHERLYRKMDFFTVARYCFKFMRATLMEGVESGRAQRRFQEMKARLLTSDPS